MLVRETVSYVGNRLEDLQEVQATKDRHGTRGRHAVLIRGTLGITVAATRKESKPMDLSDKPNDLIAATVHPIVSTPLTFGSLFAGIGGLDLGFERAGMVCKWQVEIDPFARKVLAKHWPEVLRHDDVRTWPPVPEWIVDRNAYWHSGDGVRVRNLRVDCIVGGFPCQDISYAGKGAGLQGERSGLFYEVCRIVSEMGPRFVVLENVAALLTRGMGDVLGSLASLGYDAEWHCIPAAAVGAPHIRDRVFIIAYANGWRLKKFQKRNREAESRRPAQQRDNAMRFRDDVADTSGDGREQRLPHDRRGDKGIGAWKEHRPFCSGCVPKRDQWEIEPDVGRVVDGLPGRVDRLRGLGNAVVPQVAEYVARRIIAAASSEC
jgi:DNA (cytosine-5)-methyltransferase 1